MIAKSSSHPVNPSDFSRRERQIIRALYQYGSLTARQICDHVDKPPSRTAMRTLLRILENKKVIRHKVEGNMYIYTPVQPRDQAAMYALQEMLDVFFNGSICRAVECALRNPRHPLSDPEIRYLVELVRSFVNEVKDDDHTSTTCDELA
ncbi:MAG: BlaI/MecI/CopY family transcriptional regulator [Planctomycetia bacterium]|nr:BlaI/MecI/CopY family transcriptional regulator [Planctomycetia bacterium]